VRFEVVQPIRAKRKVVVRAVANPLLYQSMGKSKTLSAPQVLDRSENADSVRLRIRYGFAGDLSRAARAILDPQKMTWVVVLDVDLDDYTAQFEMVPDHYKDRLKSSGTYRFEKTDGATVQIMEGDLKVNAPLVAGAVERVIVNGLKEHMADQAKAIEAFVDKSADTEDES
jgi:hypothetical protein